MISCHSNNTILNSQILGTWSFLEADTSYIELYIDESTLTFYSKEDGYMGPYKYMIENNNIQFNKIKYEIIADSDYSLKFRNSDYTLNLKKIDCVFTKYDTINKINPYYLRRCVSLVNIGVMSVAEALNDLDLIVHNSDEFIEEQIIEINK